VKRIMALSLAQNLLEELAPSCERIQIAGSIRRGKREVKDIEIVALPSIVESKVVDMFGKVISTSMESALDTILIARLLTDTSPWEKDEEVKRWGSRYKRLRHRETGVVCDLFLTDELRWAYQITIRTGPWKFSKAIITLALRRGWHFTDSLLHLHPKANGQPCLSGKGCSFVKKINTEAELFNALSLPWCEPADRSAEWLWEVERKRVVI